MFRSIREDIKSVYARDPAARNALEIITNYPGLHAIWLHRLNHKLWGWGWYWLARTLSNIGRFITGVEIHPGATLGRRVFIDHGMGVVIGETANIGNDVTLYHGVTLGGTSWKAGKRHPTLEDNVVVGAGAKVLGPITMGQGAKIGSNSVVVKDVPADATVVGIPGRIIVAKPSVDESGERAKIAKKYGFDAYAVSDENPDPVANAIGLLLEHVHQMDNKVIEMCQAIQDMGGDVCTQDLPKVDLQDFVDSGIEPTSNQDSEDFDPHI
jgi:serine O-acetyltransferase